MYSLGLHQYWIWYFALCLLAYKPDWLMWIIIANSFTYSMLDPVISNSISLTSWKCEASVTLKLDRSLQREDWACVGKHWSKLVFGMPSFFSFRKWNLYVGGSLPQEPNRKQSQGRLNIMFKQSMYKSELTVHIPSVESHQPKMDPEHRLCPRVPWAMGQLQHQIWWKQILGS